MTPIYVYFEKELSVYDSTQREKHAKICKEQTFHISGFIFIHISLRRTHYARTHTQPTQSVLGEKQSVHYDVFTSEIV